MTLPGGLGLTQFPRGLCVAQGAGCGAQGELQLVWFPGQDLGEKIPRAFKMLLSFSGDLCSCAHPEEPPEECSSGHLDSAVSCHCVGASLWQLHHETKKREVIVCDLMLCSCRTSLTRAESQWNL